MKSFYLTDKGILRDHNEDSLIIVENQEGNHLLAVADGMGGHNAGEVASSIAINYLGKRFQESFFKMTKTDAIKWIKNSVNEINSLVINYAKEHPECNGMGSTIVLAIVSNDYILFGNVGDSSGFVMKEKKLHKVTYDHTLVNLLVSAGELTKEEARNHPRKNILMNALGITDPIKIDIFDCILDIDGILLCSDGLTTMLSDEQIEKCLLEEETSVEEKVIKLIKKANNRGGKDNISVAYLEINERCEL